MQRKNTFSLLTLFVLALFVFTGCNKEKDEVKPADLRTQVEGTYNYKLKMYNVSSGSIQYMGSQYDESGTLIAKKNTLDANMVDFLEGGELQFQGNKLAEATNGLAFDVPSQTYIEDGQTYKIVGYEGNQIGSSKYHGAYFTTDKKVSVYFKVEGTSLVMFFEGTKQ